MQEKETFQEFVGQGPRAAAAMLLGLFIAALIFMNTAPIPRTVVATGAVASIREARAVLHDAGGVVASLPVLEGDFVARGDPIVTFNTGALAAERTALATEIIVLSAERESLLTGDAAPGDTVFSASLHDLAASFGMEESLRQEKARNIARLASDDQRTAQLEEETKSLEARKLRRILERNAKRDELSLLQDLIAMRSPLVEQGFAPKATLKELQIEEAELRGEVERLNSEIENLASEVVKAQSEAVRVPNELDFERFTRLADLSRQIADKKKRMLIVEQELAKAVVTAPVAGQVIELAANTVGSYAAPAQKIAVIAPLDEDLVINVKLHPRDIDRVTSGMSAKVVFSAFPQRALPEITTRLESVTNDVLIDEATGDQFYHAKLKIPDNIADILALEDAQTFVAGMPVDVFITVERMTVFDYLWAPLKQSFRSSFRA